jgi:hypothetical protein
MDDRLHASWDREVDGRPPVESTHDDDPLLTALIHAHPERASDAQKSLAQPQDPSGDPARHPASGA